MRRFTPRAPYNWRGAVTHALVTSLWYPATAGTPMSDHNIGPPGTPLFRLGEWADDAKPAAGPFPLIINMASNRVYVSHCSDSRISIISE